MSTHRDPTANQALGAVDREQRQLLQLAVRLRETGDEARLLQLRSRFTGIYARLLTDPLDELRKELKHRGGA